MAFVEIRGSATSFVAWVLIADSSLRHFTTRPWGVTRDEYVIRQIAVQAASQRTRPT
jgi:hypothetical protein